MRSRWFVLLILSSAFVAACNDLPSYKPAERVVWLEQNWSQEQRQWFHHANQGAQTFFVPVEWFMALEQPGFSLFGEPALISDTEFLARLGFIPDEVNQYNKAGLPVGFAVDYGATDPLSGERINSIGLTCAACHTGHMTYKGTSIRYDGGPAMVGLDRLMSVLFLSMLETNYGKFRFERFAARVLKEQDTAENRSALKKEFSKRFMMLIKHTFAAIKAQKEKAILDDIEHGRESKILHDIANIIKKNLEQTEGFGRTDALNRIGNQVFSLGVNRPENFVPVNAPVSFPFIWSSSWFTWVQYDASIMQPMVRNAGEALGVGALLNLNAAHPNNFASSVQVKNLFIIEELLSGSEAPFDARQFTGLKAPQWPEDILGDIDGSKAKAGAKLYQQYCQHCHLPPVDSSAFWDEKYWSATNQAGTRLLDLPLIPVEEIGTDPGQANVLAERTVDTTGMGIDTEVFVGPECTPKQITEGKNESFAFSLGAVVQEALDHWYKTHDISVEQQQTMNGARINCLRAPRAYKARPLNGIWATAPYLHNGSVPNLYALLSPVDERPETFYVGNLEFDPVNVGYETASETGLFLFDTSKNGNSNKGHEFNSKQGKGVIGPLLSKEDRYALIEFLKTL